MESESSNTLGSSSHDQFDNPADRNSEQSQEAEEPPTKCFKQLDRVSKLLEREVKEKMRCKFPPTQWLYEKQKTED